METTAPKLNDTDHAINSAQTSLAHVVERLFGHDYCDFDLFEGTALNAVNVRMIYLSSDIIRGIYEALSVEAGDAWRLILKTCGHIWGKRVSASLQQEISLLINKGMDELPVQQYVEIFEDYFRMNGWGKLTIDLDGAQQHGIVHASLTHSLFVSALNHLNDYVDHMVAGMLQGMFESISGQSLDCIEVTCACKTQTTTCEFIISGAERIKAIEPFAEKGATLDAIIDRLRNS